MMSTRVKICGLTRGRDVEAAVEAGADAIGFVFAPGSKRLLDPSKAGQLACLVPAFIARVGLFLDQDADQVTRILQQVPLSLLQFHGAEEGDYCRQFGRPYIKSLSIELWREWEGIAGRAEAEVSDAAGLL